MRGEFLAMLVDLVDGAAGENGDALLLHLGAHMGADVLVEAAQDVVAAIDHGDVGAEAREDAGKLQRDIAAALDDDALGQFRQMERLVRRDHVLDARDRRPMIGSASGRDQHVFGLDRLAVERRSVWASSSTARVLRMRAPDFLHIGGVDALEPGDLLVLVGDQGRPVECDLRDRSSRSLRRHRSRGGCAIRSRTASSERSRGSHRCRPCGILPRPSPWRRNPPRSGRREPRPNLHR